jgi:hypothetical protein
MHVIRSTRRLAVPTAAATALTGALLVAGGATALAEETPGQSEPFDAVGSVLATGDFNGDGKDDLAMGVPSEAIGTSSLAGAVTVNYGATGGLTEVGAELLSQDTAGVADVAQVGDRFGAAVAAGDFDGDGFDDLAIGAPDEDTAFTNAGIVHVIYGSASGLEGNPSEVWDQNSGLPDSVESADRFGAALATGDFDGNSRDDLAVGVPGESLDGKAAAGAANVVYGSATGLIATGSDFWHQQLLEIIGDEESGDQFGFAMAAGDFDGNSRDDLAISAPLDSVAGTSDMGVVNIIYGNVGGLNATGDDFWHQGVANIEGAPEANDRFGYSLAAADMGRDSRDDLAIGVPFEDVGDDNGAGAVNVIYGNVGGLNAAGDVLFDQSTSGIEGGPESSDNFGYSVAAANMGRSSQADLAVGVRQENIEEGVGEGVVQVIFGTSAGLSASNDELWHQEVTGISDTPENFDFFGTAVAAGNFGETTHADLAIGVPGEDVHTPSVSNGGAVNVIYGDTDGLTNSEDQFWTQGRP